MGHSWASAPRTCAGGPRNAALLFVEDAFFQFFPLPAWYPARRRRRHQPPLPPSESPLAPGSMGPSDHLNLNAHAYVSIVSHANATTASATTRKHQTTEVSLRPARPPLPSDLLVHCPGLDPADFAVPPRIIRTAEGLLLLRVAIGLRLAGRLRLLRLPRRHRKGPVARAAVAPAPLLPRRRRRPPRPRRPLHHRRAVCHAHARRVRPPLVPLRVPREAETWSCRHVSVEEPQGEFPLKVPRNCYRLFYHDTTTVITIGGEGGTMGWVDLWRGILLGDVLHDEPTLRGVPLPMPVDERQEWQWV